MKYLTIIYRPMFWACRVIVLKPIMWVSSMIPFRWWVVCATCAIALFVFENRSPGHWMAKAIYFESRDEPILGRYAVANVVLNRVDDNRWPGTIAGVVNDGRERGRLCDFSFMCDGLHENPWHHHYTHWPAWVTIRAEAWVVLALDALHLRWDPTTGALFYKRRDVHSPWFAEEIAAGRMAEVARDFGAHHFFTYTHERRQARLP